MADAYSHPPKIRPEQRVDRAQSVMAGRTAAAFHPKLTRPQIDLVVDHGDFRRRNPKEPRCLGNRLARIVHVGLWLQQEPSLAADHPLRKLAFEAATKARDAMTSGDQVNRHEADIVSVPGIARARIAKADDETHHTVRSRTPPNRVKKLRLRRLQAARLPEERSPPRPLPRAPPRTPRHWLL